MPKNRQALGKVKTVWLNVERAATSDIKKWINDIGRTSSATRPGPTPVRPISLNHFLISDVLVRPISVISRRVDETLSSQFHSKNTTWQLAKPVQTTSTPSPLPYWLQNKMCTHRFQSQILQNVLCCITVCTPHVMASFCLLPRMHWEWPPVIGCRAGAETSDIRKWINDIGRTKTSDIWNSFLISDVLKSTSDIGNYRYFVKNQSGDGRLQMAFKIEL